MLEAGRAGDRGQGGSHAHPGCSAARGGSGLNLTSWSSYRGFTDQSPCQAHLATTSTSAAGQVNGSWEAVSALTDHPKAEREQARLEELSAAEAGRKHESRSSHPVTEDSYKPFSFQPPIFSLFSPDHDE